MKKAADILKEFGVEYKAFIISAHRAGALLKETVEQVEKDGFEVTYLEVDENGFVSVEDLEKAIRPDTAMVSVMFASERALNWSACAPETRSL